MGRTDQLPALTITLTVAGSEGPPASAADHSKLSSPTYPRVGRYSHWNPVHSTAPCAGCVVMTAVIGSSSASVADRTRSSGVDFFTTTSNDSATGRWLATTRMSTVATLENASPSVSWNANESLPV